MQLHSTFLPVLGRTVTLLTIVVVALVGSALAERVLYSFASGTDASEPQAPLILDAAGNLYGTTTSGGNGYGTVFKLTRSGGGWSESVLYSFTGASDGANPYGGLVMDTAGNLYGTAFSGGDFGCGTVYELTPSGGTWTEHSLHGFGGAQGDGCNPFAGLAIDANGNIFGTTQNSGLYGAGIVFEVTLSGGVGTESVLWSFNNADGDNPRASVIFDNSGNIYGTTSGGGPYGSGNVFRLTPVSGGGWTETSIFSFTGGDNGCSLQGGVVFDAEGNLYGTAQGCGADEVGTAFKLTPTVGQWKMSILHTFTGGADGGGPVAVVFDKAGNLWGTTVLGGLFANGTVFRLAPPSSGSRWKETEYGFKGGNDGAFPSAGVVFGTSSTGTIAFGTTVEGGASGLGTVYEIVVK